jgi:hypothetical protein
MNDKKFGLKRNKEDEKKKVTEKLHNSGRNT